MEYSQDKSSNRQTFNIEQSQLQKQYEDDSDYITVDKPHVVLTLWNLLVTGTCIGLFTYVNSYFAIQLDNILNGTTIRSPTQTFSCDYYYCDRTFYNFMHYYSYYNQCNKLICGNLVCSMYQCGSGKYYLDLNRYFACQPTCPNYQRTDYPQILMLAYALALCAAVCFALNIIVHIFMGIMLNIGGKKITKNQRVALMLGFVWPSLKYYFFRQRKYWTNFDISLKAIITADYICACLLTITMAIYIWFYVIGAWFGEKEISLFFILLGSFITHWMMCWANGRALWKAQQRFQ